MGARGARKRLLLLRCADVVGQCLLALRRILSFFCSSTGLMLGAAVVVVVVVGSRCEDETRDEAAVEQVEGWEQVGWEESVEG